MRVVEQPVQVPAGIFFFESHQHLVGKLGWLSEPIKKSISLFERSTVIL
jgi:hypothetical protein